MTLLRWQRPGLTRWQNFNALSSLGEELDRLFQAPLAGLARTSAFLNGGTPALDIHEDKDNFVVKAELPGMKKEDIDISLQDGVLSISGERKSEEKLENAEVYRSERFFG